jgi:CheY-like chemotaxis protein
MRSDDRPWLVCDDNLLMAEVVCEFLRECGLDPVGPVGRLESAMQMARERALDGAILDINLNGRPCFPVCLILSAQRVRSLHPRSARPLALGTKSHVDHGANPQVRNKSGGLLGHDWSFTI